MVTVDGCTACAHVVHATNEIITIYPITPSSPIAEICDAKSAAGQKNIWGSVPMIGQMQSGAGAAGAVHGSLTTGALTSTITASQGLLLFIPNMYKIAGGLIPTVFHVTAQGAGPQALSIFGDHGDVMAVRDRVWRCSRRKTYRRQWISPSIAQAATFEARVPSSTFSTASGRLVEIQKIEELELRRHAGDDRQRPDHGPPEEGRSPLTVP